MVVYPSKRRYDAENVIKVTVAFNRRTDPDVCEALEAEEHRAAWIRERVREALRRRGGPDEEAGR